MAFKQVIIRRVGPLFWLLDDTTSDSMKILTYKRTHIGDPSPNGVFGVGNCMRRVRNYDFDAVIGVGGISYEPRRLGISGKVNWIGCTPYKRRTQSGFVLVKFKYFKLFEESGPMLHDMAPLLAKRMYKGAVRFIINGYTAEEQKQAENIVNWLIEQCSTEPKKYEPSNIRQKCIQTCRQKALSQRRCRVI